MTGRPSLFLALAVMGAGWGLTQPLSKIAVSTGRLPFGLIFWQFLAGAALLYAIQRLRRRPFPTHRAAWRVYVFIAILGTLIPNASSFLAYAHVPAGIMSILISTVPMAAFAISLVIGSDRFSWARFGGLALGLLGIVLIVAPEGGLPDRSVVPWVLLGLVAPLFYAIEANYVDRAGTAGLGAMQVLLGASVVGTAMALPLALATGQFFWLGAAGVDAALLASSVIHALAYSGYVWIVGRAGATFAAQVSYMVTGFGVMWAIILLGETYSGWVWLAMILVLGGMALVQPRDRLAEAAEARDNSRARP